MTSCQQGVNLTYYKIGPVQGLFSNKCGFQDGSGDVQEQGAHEYWGNGRAARVTKLKLPLDQKEQSVTQEAQL